MSEVTLSLGSRLGDLVAPGRVVTDAASLAGYEVDGARPSAALLPDSAAEIAEILRFASAEGLAVIPIGGKNHLGLGMPPRRYDLALDLTGMNRILAYEPRDLTLGIEPGVTCADLECQLREKLQFLPLAPPFWQSATLGGMIGAGADIPLRYGHGTARDFLLGIEFVTGDGLVSKSGGRVVKNVTGYDLHKLFIGSLGTLGVITRLNFRTFPLPPGQRMFVVGFSDLSGAFDLCRAIRKAPLHPRIVEVVDPGSVGLFAAHGANFIDQASWLVVVEAAGHDAVIKRHARDLASMAGEAHAMELIALEESQRNRLLSCLSDFSRIALDASPSAAIFRIAALPSVMPALIEKIRRLADDHELKCAILVRALSIVYIAVIPPANINAFPALIGCSREITGLCIRSGAAPMLERCPLEIKNALGVWPPPGDEHEIVQRLKRVFDPREILSPGRFRGGI